MKEAVLPVEEFLYAFYEKVGQQAGGIPAEKVMEDALFKLAGELSLQAMESQFSPIFSPQPGGGLLREAVIHQTAEVHPVRLL